MHNNRYPQMKQGDIMKVYASKRNLIWWCNLMQIAITHNCDFHAAYNCISFMLWTFVILNLTKQLEISISFLMYNDTPLIVWHDIAGICKLKKSKEYICIWCVSIVVGFHLKSCKDVMIWLAIHIFRLILWGTCAVCNTWKVTHFLLLAITLMILMRFLLIVDYH